MKSAIPVKAIVEAVDSRTSVESAISAFAQDGQAAILDSSRSLDQRGRFSILAVDPIAIVSLTGREPRDPLTELAERITKRCPVVAKGTDEIPFVGGWIGYLSYETGLPMHRISPQVDAGMAVPSARFGLHDAAAIYDHLLGRWFLTAIDWPTGLGLQRPPVSERLNQLRRRLDAAAHLEWEDPALPFAAQPQSNMPRWAYTRKVRKVKQYIEAGDVYQVNLARRFTTQTNASPVDLYLRLRKISPSSQAALLMWDNTAILSSSPELFLNLHDGHVVTRPIKGTRPRTGNPRADAAARRELATSDKERAELIMIVDLLRNDLGRVCSYGTVRVTEPGEIEEHPQVFHRVATIEGRLEHGKDWSDLLRATFPGGSVTGAPKIRAMQIIRELEPTRRGVYCGSIGWIGLDGSMSLNLAIRTMVQEGDSVDSYVGSGIVAESTPDAEYEETMAKARGMLQALNAEELRATAPAVCEAVSAT